MSFELNVYRTCVFVHNWIITDCQCKNCDYMVNMVVCWVHMSHMLKELVPQYAWTPPQIIQPQRRKRGSSEEREREMKKESRPECRNSECWDYPLLPLLSKAEPPWPWFESYLSRSSFRSSWQAQLLAPPHLSTGVPQGSVLGPMLSAIYITLLGHGFFIPVLCRWHPPVFFPGWTLGLGQTVSHVSASETSETKDHHIRINVVKTELLDFPANQPIQYNTDIKIDSLCLALDWSWLMINWLSDHVAWVSRSLCLI